jgi:hypothetical protein
MPATIAGLSRSNGCGGDGADSHGSDRQFSQDHVVLLHPFGVTTFHTADGFGGSNYAASVRRESARKNARVSARAFCTKQSHSPQGGLISSNRTGKDQLP